MKHLNGHLLCVIDTETTGLKAGYHDVVQVCVLPIAPNLTPLKGVNPFYTTLQPKFPERAEAAALRVNKLDMAALLADGIEPYRAADLFEEWFKKLGLPERKKIAPLGHNYPFDRGFLQDWLGHESYEAFFDYHIRDTATASLFLNDHADFHNEACPYPKQNLKYLASTLGVESEGAHDAMNDCIITAECYRRMCAKGNF